eukprot:5789797-Amphidinium_carterae.1
MNRGGMVQDAFFRSPNPVCCRHRERSATLHAPRIHAHRSRERVRPSTCTASYIVRCPITRDGLGVSGMSPLLVQ